MADSVADLKKFLNRPDVPASQVIKLLGRKTPSTMYGGHVLNPFDKRYERIVVRLDPKELRLVKQIQFQTTEENPICMGDLVPIVGKFKCRFKRKTKETEFRARGFEEGSIIDYFGTRMEKYQFEGLDDGTFQVHLPNGQIHALQTSDIFIDYFTFNFKDREPPPDEEVKPPRNSPF
ncbi:MAG: hypothetical protein AAGN35_13215 [Bacteroidota bacterium]